MQQMPVFLRAEWRNLVMLNYECDPALLAPYTPQGTELDAFNGVCYLSVVGFLFLNTTVLGMPIPLHRNFEELNLRFYVRRQSAEGWKRGVVFIKEVVPRRAIASIARIVYNENYIAAPMRHSIDKGADGNLRSVAYEWRAANRWNIVSAQADKGLCNIATGSLEEYITEHYWGYVAQKNGTTKEYEVGHPRWKIWQTTAASFDCDVASMYGPEFVAALSGRPQSSFIAEGSEIVVHKGRLLH